MEQRIAAFQPEDKNAREMYAVCKEFLGLEKVIAVEVDHCP